MRFNTKSLLVLILVTGNVLWAGRRNQNPSEQNKEKPVITSTVEVPVDVIVRDKGGRPIKGLTASDFEVYENGVPQQITSVRMVSREPSDNQMNSKTQNVTGVTSAETASAASSTSTTSLLVFDRLTPDTQVRARDAALNYVNENMKSDSRMGVFVTGLSLRRLQPLTEDAQLVRDAVEQAASVSTTSNPSVGKDARAVRNELSEVIRTVDPKAIPAGDPFRRDRLSAQLHMLEGFEYLQREQQGNATINGPIAIIDSLREVPGRKAVIFLSEGLVIPPSVEPLMRSAINSASRAGVTVYTVDTAGLRIGSQQAETSKEIQSHSDLRMAQLGNAVDPVGPMTKDLERNEDILRSDSRSGLEQLADQTGGFMIRDTNDLKGRMNRIDDDLRTYYLVNYTPKDQSSDGSFRKIEVKVKRSGVSVQNRKGYYAINTSYGSPVLDFETPALAIAANNRRPKDLAVRSSAMSFPEASRTGLVVALAEIPMQGITFHTEDKTKTFSTDFSVVAIFKSSDKQVVRKQSHHYLLTGRSTL